MAQSKQHEQTNEAGFSLIEVVIAMSILLVGLFGMAQVFYMGLNIAATSTPNLIAREKAREAIESVHTARDTHTILWAQIRNEEAPEGCPNGTTGVGGGVFKDGIDEDMQAPGPDGLVNTGDDAGQERMPGPDGLLGTGDEDDPNGDDDIPLVGYEREIRICDVTDNENLRQIVVTIRYDGSKAFGQSRREYTLITFISRFS